jgi:hypothetical protein
MPVWAISDLHLSHARPARLERFAGRWRDHVRLLEENWRACVSRDDLVLIPGDISLARNHREVQPDLAWLENLPGTKVLSPGNHDAWWNNVEAIRPLLRRSQHAVEGDALVIGNVIICGARGAPPLGDEPTPELRSGWERELASLDGALQHAHRLRSAGEPIYALWHLPPFDAQGRPSAVVERLEAAGVSACVYGHLHQTAQWALAKQGEHRGVRYYCVAADAVGFRPFRIDRSP